MNLTQYLTIMAALTLNRQTALEYAYSEQVFIASYWLKRLAEIDDAIAHVQAQGWQSRDTV